MQIKTFYYELVYRILCEVNLSEVRSALHFENLRLHLEVFSNELVVLLTFLYNPLLKCSFTSDPHFMELNLTYELKSIFENIRVIHSRWEFFKGRLTLQGEANQQKKEIKREIESLKER